MLGRVKRARKIPSSFKDFVSSDVQEQPMMEEGMHSVALILICYLPAGRSV